MITVDKSRVLFFLLFRSQDSKTTKPSLSDGVHTHNRGTFTENHVESVALGMVLDFKL